MILDQHRPPGDLLRHRLLRIVSAMHVSGFRSAFLPLLGMISKRAGGGLLISIMLHVLNTRAQIYDLFYLFLELLPALMLAALRLSDSDLV